jgi:hypothetical protein
MQKISYNGFTYQATEKQLEITLPQDIATRKRPNEDLIDFILACFTTYDEEGESVIVFSRPNDMRVKNTPLTKHQAELFADSEYELSEDGTPTNVKIPCYTIYYLDLHTTMDDAIANIIADPKNKENYQITIDTNA